MKINVITPVRPGGPYHKGKELVEVLKGRGVTATWTHRLSRVLASSLWQNSDVVHSMDVPIGYRLWKRPLIFAIRGDYTIEKTKWQRLYPIAIRKADAVTVNSLYMKDRLDLKDATVIPTSIFCSKFERATHTEKDTLKVVTVSGFYFKDKSQGILNILGILEKAQKNIKKEIVYSVVGGGPCLAEVKAGARKYDVHVEFTDMVPHPGEILRQSDVFLYYSVHDETPNVLMEAMASGLPVITNNVGAVKEMVSQEKDGYVADTDEAYLEHALDLLKNADLRVRIGDSAYKTAHARFDWERVIDQYINLYDRLLGKNKDDGRTAA